MTHETTTRRHRRTLRAALISCIAALVAPGGAASAQTSGLIEDIEPGNNSIGTAPTLNSPGTTTLVGLLELTAGDFDVIGVTLAAGDRLSVMTTPLVGPEGSFTTPDTVVIILNSVGTPQFFDDDAGFDSVAGGLSAPRGSLVRFRPNSSGVYFVRVTALNEGQTGPYILTLAIASANTLAVAETHNDTALSAQVLRPDLAGPIAVAGAISPAADFDHYALDLNLNDVLSVHTNPVADPANFSAPPLRLRLLDTDGVTVLVESLGTGTDFPVVDAPRGNGLRARVPADGRYYLQVSGVSPADTGAYHMFLTVLPAAPVNTCPSDLNDDGQTDARDLAALLASWGACP